jgi:membrane protease YdiL (CAAX protease family)
MNFSFNLRNISTLIMSAAIAASLIYRIGAESKIVSAAAITERQNSIMIRMIMAEAVASRRLATESIPEKLQEIKQLFELMEKSDDIKLTLAQGIIFDYLGHKEMMSAADTGTAPEDITVIRDYIQLYENDTAISEDSPLFSIPAGDLARLKNFEIQGNDTARKDLDEKLFSDSIHITSVFFIIAVVAVLFFIASIVISFWFFRKKKESQYSKVLSDVDSENRAVMLETVILFLFFMFPVNMLIHAVIGNIPAAKEHMNSLFFQMVYIPLIFSYSIYNFIHIQKNGREVLYRLLFNGQRPDIRREMMFGIMGFTGIFPLALMFTVITVQLSGQNPGSAENAHPLVFELNKAPLLIFIFASMIVPVVEEVIFRVFFYGYLRTKMSIYTSAFISGTLFAVLHPQGWVALPYLTILGMGLALIREYRPGIIASITVHSIVNGMATVGAWYMLYN